jgi:hypothetical protein
MPLPYQGNAMPKKKYTLTFREVSIPIVEPVTKVGGQPVWVTEPLRPLICAAL